jgi:hypothetical protein
MQFECGTRILRVIHGREACATPSNCTTILTRSVGVTLARRFNAGERVVGCSRRVATTEFPNILKLFSAVAMRREYFVDSYPALNRRARLMMTLRVDRT